MVNLLQTFLIILTIGVTGFFIWRVIKYIQDPTASHLRTLLMSTVGVAVFALLWGIVAFLGQVFGIDDKAESGRLITPGLDQSALN